jgi:hypothetical protein
MVAFLKKWTAVSSSLNGKTLNGAVRCLWYWSFHMYSHWWILAFNANQITAFVVRSLVFFCNISTSGSHAKISNFLKIWKYHNCNIANSFELIGPLHMRQDGIANHFWKFLWNSSGSGHWGLGA